MFGSGIWVGSGVVWAGLLGSSSMDVCVSWDCKNCFRRFEEIALFALSDRSYVFRCDLRQNSITIYMTKNQSM